jgi:hypothetical protein
MIVGYLSSGFLAGSMRKEIREIDKAVAVGYTKFA